MINYQFIQLDCLKKNNFPSGKRTLKKRKVSPFECKTCVILILLTLFLLMSSLLITYHIVYELFECHGKNTVSIIIHFILYGPLSQ